MTGMHQTNTRNLRSFTKKHEETPCELVARIYQMVSHAHIGGGSAIAIEFECFIRAISDDEIELRHRLLAAPLTATTNELLTIAESFYAVAHGA